MAPKPVLVPSRGSQGTEECESIHLRFSPDHVLCKQNDGACQLIRTGINNTDKDAILHLHNHFRSQVAIGNTSGLPPASDMLEMEWDEELARVAQAHANLCSPQPSCPSCIRIEKFPFVGRTGCVIRSNSEDNTRDWEGCIRDMHGEASRIPSASSNSPLKTTRGAESFSQLAWAKTWRVGCGYAMYPSQRQGSRFEKRFTCAYGPGGNMRGEDVYKVGQPCSDCPEGTCCGASCRRYGYTAPFEGLCTGYAEAVLEAGQSAEMTFDQIIRPGRGSLCVVAEYSKGPNVAGQPDRGLFNLVVTPVERPERQRTINFSGGSSAVLRMRVTLMYDVPLQVGALNISNYHVRYLT
ncbi:hypothetical protein HPB48_012214 [Haemaphysalis longicornis]|uniref:SCP domain-containing protein n=1 Tax=Haemaphysalis longicornis TaxID=44386 RepID=A0A9J6FMH8_HAELO|nr:hypothetical protein HPB48_012214 [Haemaphysalis longicornis]